MFKSIMPIEISIRKMTTSDSLQVATIHTRSWQEAYRGIVAQEFLDSIDLKKREENWEKGIELNDPPLIRLVAEDRSIDGIDHRLIGFICGLENRRIDLLPSLLEVSFEFVL